METGFSDFATFDLVLPPVPAPPVLDQQCKLLECGPAPGGISECPVTDSGLTISRARKVECPPCKKLLRVRTLAENHLCGRTTRASRK